MKMHWTLSGIGLLAGFAIISLSLWRAAAASAAPQPAATSKKFYVNDRIKPDHVLFPVVNAGNKMQIALGDTEEQVQGNLHLAVERKEDAQELLQQGNTEQAFSSLLRAQYHLVRAEQLSHAEPNGDQLRETIRAQAEDLHQYFLEIEDQMPDLFDSEMVESNMLFRQLDASVSASQ